MRQARVLGALRDADGGLVEDDVDALHRLGQQRAVADVASTSATGPVRSGAGEVVVPAADEVVERRRSRRTLVDQPVDDVRADQPGAAGDQDRGTFAVTPAWPPDSEPLRSSRSARRDCTPAATAASADHFVGDIDLRSIAHHFIDLAGVISGNIGSDRTSSAARSDMREVARPVAEIGVGLLQVDRDRVVDAGLRCPLACSVALQPVALGGADGVDVVDVAASAGARPGARRRVPASERGRIRPACARRASVHASR